MLKDYAQEPEVEVVRRAAHQMVTGLAQSLALVTAKEPLRIAVGNNLRALLQAQLEANTLDQVGAAGWALGAGCWVLGGPGAECSLWVMMVRRRGSMQLVGDGGEGDERASTGACAAGGGPAAPRCCAIPLGQARKGCLPAPWAAASLLPCLPLGIWRRWSRCWWETTWICAAR